MLIVTLTVLVPAFVARVTTPPDGDHLVVLSGLNAAFREELTFKRVGDEKIEGLLASPAGTRFAIELSRGERPTRRDIAIFDAKPLRLVGRVAVKNQYRWLSESRLLFTDPAGDWRAATLQGAGVLVTRADERPEPVLVDHGRLAAQAANGAGIRRVGPILPQFSETAASNSVGHLVIDRSGETVFAVGVQGGAFDGGACGVYMLTKSKGWQPRLLGFFAISPTLHLKGRWLAVSYPWRGQQFLSCFNIDKGEWSLLGEAHAFDILVATDP